MKETKTFQYYFSGEWIDTTEGDYLKMINNNHHGRIIESGEIIEQTDGAPKSSRIFIDGQFDENAYSNIYNPDWKGYKKKDDNLPPDNETVEDGGGCYVAGSREQDAAHSFEKFEGHTPGPWEIDDYKQGILYTHDTGFKFHICIIGSGDSTTMTDEEEIANLALIAEAPNLLAELTRLRSELQQKDEVIKKLIEAQKLQS